MKRLFSLILALAAVEAQAITATKEYVDSATNEVVRGTSAAIIAATNGVPKVTDSTVGGWGYIKSWTEMDPTISAWAKATAKPTYTWNEIGSKPTFAAVATSGAYSDLTGKPSIPTDSTVSGWGYIKSWTETDPTISAWAKATAKPSYTWNEIGSKPSWIGSTKPSYTWNEITSKPTTFTPSTHSHASDSWFTDALSAKLPAEYVGGDNDEYQVVNDVYFAGRVALNMGKVYDDYGNLQDVAGVHQIPTDSTVAGWGYIKSWTEMDPTISAWAKATAKPTYTWNEIGSKPTFAAVATSGAYSDLTGKPSIPTDSTVAGWGYIKSWTETDPTISAWAKATSKPSYTWTEIGSKPTFAAVATSGAYSDLAGKPSIPTDSTVAGWGYIKSWTETDPTISAWAKATTKPSYTWTEVTGLADELDGKLDKSGGDGIASISWDDDGVNILINAGLIVNPDGGFGGLYLGGTEYDNEVWNIGDIRYDFSQYSWDWSAINNTPDTIEGYGITDAASTADLAEKQDALPYATNAIPAAAISNAPWMPASGGTVVAATLEYHADGTAIEVMVAASGTFSATLTGWPDGQSQMAFVTLAAGATVSPAIKLIGYSDWTTGEEFMAVATRRNNKIYLNPVCITEE